jgi:hypothetical protein
VDKSLQILNAITFLSSLFVDEMARERQRSGLTDAQLLERAGVQSRANEVKILNSLAKAGKK